MFNSKITLFTRNILETGTFTVTGDADSGYPESRLHDRETSLYWKQEGTTSVIFEVDQSSSPKSVDVLIINDHDFDGKNMAWQYSDNGEYWVDAVDKWTQSGNGQIVKTLETALTKNYWRLLVSTDTISTTTTTSSTTTSSSSSSSSSTTTTTA